MDLAYYVLKIKREQYGDILLPDTARVEHVDYGRAYKEGFEECLYRVPDLLKLEKLLNVIPATPLKKTILDLAELLKKENTHEQVRQHERDVQQRETAIPRLTRTAVR